MKICLISNLFPPIFRGGAEKVAQTVACGLKSANHDVFIISTKSWDGWKSLKSTAADENGIKVYRFYPFNIFYYLNDFKHNVLMRSIWHFLDLFNFHSAIIVKKILKKEKPDFVMTHNLTGIGFLIPGAIREIGIKQVHTLHDVQLSIPSGLIMKGQENSWQQRTWLRKIYEVICRWLFASPDVVISPSQWLMDFYTRKGFFRNSKKIVLPNPVTAPFPHPNFLSSGKMGSSLPIGERIKARGNNLKLLYLGQIEEHKGILFLVNVLKKLDIDFKLHIAGDGTKLDEVRQLVFNDLRFVVHGRLKSEAVKKIFSEVDLTIVPSLCYENSPTVIYESLSFGVPVLAAKIGGVAELVHDGGNGFTFEAGNAEDLTRVLKRAAANRDELQKMRLRAAESVKEFVVEVYIQRLLSSI